MKKISKDQFDNLYESLYGSVSRTPYWCPSELSINWYLRINGKGKRKVVLKIVERDYGVFEYYGEGV